MRRHHNYRQEISFQPAQNILTYSKAKQERTQMSLVSVTMSFRSFHRKLLPWPLSEIIHVSCAESLFSRETPKWIIS